MTYALTLLYVALLYVRPGEILPQLADLPIVAVTGAAAIVSGAGSLLTKPRPFAQLPNDWAFLGFALAAVLSVPANGWLGGGYVTFIKILPILTVYLLIRISVRTTGQWRRFAGLLVVLTLFQAANGIMQYWTGVGFGNSTAYAERYDQGSDDLMDGRAGTVVRRVRGTGIFGDPNDLAMALVLVFPFLYTAVLARDEGGGKRLFALAALGVLSYALFLTQSRGGLVGLAAVTAAYAYRRTGRIREVAVALVIAGLLLVGASGRLKEMSSSEDSAQGRIQAWSAGLQMLKSKPALGVGYGAYTNYHHLVAHNSFVHAFAELGLVGGYFFIGMFFWLLTGNGSARDVNGAATSPLARDVWSSCIGVMVCAVFLSRQYSPVLYVLLALGAARIGLGEESERETPARTRSDWALVMGLTAGTVVAAYVAVRLLAVWAHA